MEYVLKPFVIKLGCFLLIQGAILIAVLNFGSQDATNNDYLYTLKDKIELLKTTPSPRIVFAGGSNLAFGLNSEFVKQETGFNPVNLGLHGRLGIYPLIRMLEKHVRDGDTVVLAPEYSILFASPGCTEPIGIEAYRTWPGCREFIQPDIDQPLPELVPQPSPLKWLAETVYRARKRLSTTSRDLDPDSGTYQRNSFNQYGDHVAHHHIAAPEFNESEFQEINESCFQNVAERLNAFHQFCNSRNVRVVLTQPPSMRSKTKKHPGWGNEVQKLFDSRVTIPVITDFKLLTFDDDLFYDSSSHLTQLGAEIRTRIICDQLTGSRIAKLPHSNTFIQ